MAEQARSNRDTAQMKSAIKNTAYYASDPAKSRGRLYQENRRSHDELRDAFQHDRDRIIHSRCFRRLGHKTQVFVAPDGDHYRVRLTHSLEVAQIGRTLARALGLNEDLTEALCLAHDTGHPPFGHAGEKALNTAMTRVGGFDHNGHALRILMRLENPYPMFDGLNLNWETLEGLAKHNGPVEKPPWALSNVDSIFPLDLDACASLEAQIAAVADDIAYDNHDIDDGLRAGLLNLDTLMEQPFIAANYYRAETRFPQASPEKILRELVRNQIDLMVGDVLSETQQRITRAGVESPQDVRHAGATLAGFSPTMAEQEHSLKRFLYARLYHHPSQIAAAQAAHHVTTRLFEAYADEKLSLGSDGDADKDADTTKTNTRMAQTTHKAQSDAQNSEQDDESHLRRIGDYIAGMTDRFAIDRFAYAYGRNAIPQELRRMISYSI